MKAVKIAISLVLALPLAAIAQDANTPPSPSAQQDNNGGRSFGRFGRFRGMYGASTRPASVEEWDEAMSFLEKNSPNRYRMLKEIDPSETSFLRTQVLKKWRNYKLIRERFPELAELGIERYQIEDELFGITAQARSDPSGIESLRSQVRDLANKLVHLDIQEEQIRVKKLQELLASEQKLLQEKQNNVDGQIDDRTTRIMDRMMRPGGGGPGGGGPGGGPMRDRGGDLPPRGDASPASGPPDQAGAMASAGLVLPDQLLSDHLLQDQLDQ
jgi:hypothetical protein